MYYQETVVPIAQLAATVTTKVQPVATKRPAAGRPVGFVGSAARHHELGPIALAVLKRNVPVAAVLEVDGMPATQEVVVDPEVGLHVRPDLR